MESKFKSDPAIVHSCKYHVTWCSKYRRKVLIEGVDKRLKEILKEICDQFEAKLVEVEVMPDHVHILVEVDPKFGIVKLVRYLKGRSSRRLRDEFSWLRSRLPTLWTKSYFVATVGVAPLSEIEQYIESQKNV